MLKRMMQHTAIAITLAVAAIPAAIGAQDRPNTPPGGGDVSAATQDCANGIFNFGAGATQFSTCVSSHGNIASFKVQNSEHIDDNGGVAREGYIVCATIGSPAVAKTYVDTMEFESGWGFASAGTPGTLPITVTRSTTDGAFTLTQTYAKDNAERDFTVTMKLKANVPAVGVKLVRMVDMDVDQPTTGSFTHHFDHSLDSVWGSAIRAMTATALTYNISHYPSYSGFTTVCDNPAATAPADGDLGAVLQYNLGSMNAGNNKVVKVAYRGM